MTSRCTGPGLLLSVLIIITDVINNGRVPRSRDSPIIRNRIQLRKLFADGESDTRCRIFRLWRHVLRYC